MLSVQDITSRCAPILEASPLVQRAYLFGSFARGDQVEGSDVDICYDRPQGDGLPTGLAYLGLHGELRRALEGTLGRRVDLLVSPSEAGCAFPSQVRFAQEVLRDRRMIYERAQHRSPASANNRRVCR